MSPTAKIEKYLVVEIEISPAPHPLKEGEGLDYIEIEHEGRRIRWHKVQAHIQDDVAFIVLDERLADSVRTT